MKTLFKHRKPSSAAAILLVGVLALPAQAQSPLAVAQTPLFVGGVDPNVLFILDDSGSMNFFFMPDSIGRYTLTTPSNSNSNCQSEANMPRMLTSAYFNKMYFDPTVSYLPPLDANGNPLPEASFTGAWENGFNRSGATTDLSTRYRARWSDQAYATAGTKCTVLDSTNKAAYYHTFNAGNVGCSINNATTPPTPNNNCFTRVTVGADEQQNFANWYSYYRNRMLTAKTGVSRAFAQATTGLNMGYGSINSSNTVVRGVLPFKDGTPATANTYRTQFFEWLFGKNASGGTPLRLALDNAGKYYEEQAAPWNSKPWDTANGNPISCRQSYTILMTDGYWNGSAAATNARNDQDGTNGTTITRPSGSSFTYAPRAPFKDAPNTNYAGTLADVAMYYWKRDLRPELTNNVPVGANSRNEAFWQHMSTFTIGLGLLGNIDSTRAFNAITATTGSPDFGYPGTWPVPAADSENNLDDLLHAAVNGRGGFFSASNPTEFANALNSTLTDIAARSAAFAKLTLSSKSISSDLLAYSATMDSGSWSGEVTAYRLDANNNTNTQIAKASTRIPAAASRQILTWRPAYTSGVNPVPAQGVTFQWDSLSPAQQTAFSNGITSAGLGSITPANVLAYVRGDRSLEKSNSGTLRNRDGVLGDIVNSDPVYARKVNYGYAGYAAVPAAARASYNTFYKSIRPMLYVGANDGMLHAFDGSTDAGTALREVFAYVPNNVIGTLPFLAKDVDFAHRYYVDGPVTLAHAYLNNSWRAILIGSTGAGGRAYFAIDVTNPDSPEVLWEFTHEQLGLTMGKAAVVLLPSGEWAAIFGNGYNSNAQGAGLFVVRLSDGQLLSYLPVTSRSSTLANGLAAPAVSDLNGDGAADFIYAGDLQGSVWKFDLSASSSTSWNVAFGGTPLFQTPITTEGTGASAITRRQPITAKVAVASRPAGGVMVYFGTGKYFETGDQSNVDPQAFYAIPDVCGQTAVGTCASGASTGRVSLNQLLQQTFTETTQTFTNSAGDSYTETVRSTSTTVDTTKIGYYMPLKAGTTNTGERVFSEPIINSTTVEFYSSIPNDDVCSFGGTSWHTVLDLYTGARPAYSVFDFNRDGSFTETANARQLEGIHKGGDSATDSSGTKGVNVNQDAESGNPNMSGFNPNRRWGRQTWREIR